MGHKADNNRVGVMPYCEIDGVRNYPDTFIRGLYLQMTAEGTVETVFHDGRINSADDFLRAMKSSNNCLYLVCLEKKIVGIVWLNRIEATSAHVHFCGFKESWGEQSERIGRETMRMLLGIKSRNGKYLFDVLLGLIPAGNERAVNWLLDIGLQKVGVIPHGLFSIRTGKSIDGLILSLTREDLE
jgi:hypothetical protein